MMKNNSRLKLVVDTNVFIASFTRKSPYYWFYRKLHDKDFDLAVSNEILFEYEEKFSQIFDSFVSANFIESILVASNVSLVTPYYHWNLIDADPDDNKFVDCAIASGADYIVSNDKHFNVLKSIGFPPVTVITIDEFLAIMP